MAFGIVGGAKADEPGKKIYEKDWTAPGSYSMYNEGFTTGKSIGIVSSALQVVNGAATVNNWDLQYFVGDGFPIKKGANYVVRIGIQGSEAGSLTCVFGGWEGKDKNTSLAFTTTASDVDVTFKDMPGTVANAHVLLQSGAFVGTLTITKVQVFELESVDTYGDAIATFDYTQMGSFDRWKEGFSGNKTIGIDGGVLKIYNDANVNYWTLQYSVADATTEIGKNYILRTTIKGSGDGTIHCSMGAYPNESDGSFKFNNGWQTIETLFSNVPVTNSGVTFKSGDFVGTIEIEKVTVHPVVEGRLVEVGDAGYSTFSANKAVKMRGVTAYGAKYDGSKIVLTPVTEVPAGAGVIIEAAEDTYKIPVIESAAALGSINELQVSDGSVPGDGSTIYALGKKGVVVGFVKVKSGVTIPAGKAYLTLPATARDFIGFGEDVTGVEVVKQESKADNEYFNLAGQRVAQPTKGLYIVNGKKVIIK